MKVDTHGLVFKGLKKAAGETKSLTGANGEYLQISYDRQSGEVLTNYHVSLGFNSWTHYHDYHIITVCNTAQPMTMQAIADATHDAVIEQDLLPA